MGKGVRVKITAWGWLRGAGKGSRKGWKKLASKQDRRQGRAREREGDAPAAEGAMRLSPRDSAAFAAAIEDPPAPSPALREAAARHAAPPAERAPDPAIVAHDSYVAAVRHVRDAPGTHMLSVNRDPYTVQAASPTEAEWRLREWLSQHQLR